MRRICLPDPAFIELVACNMRFASDQMGKTPCESVESVSSVVNEFERIPLLVPHRPRMTLIRRICTDTAPSLAICLLQATSSTLDSTCLNMHRAFGAQKTFGVFSWPMSSSLQLTT